MDDKVSENAAISLQQIVDQERKKRVDAENMAAALVEEFTNCNDFDDIRQKFRDKIKDFAPTALLNIINLANNAESESVRSSLNKWVLEWLMSDKIDGSNNELQSLLKELKSNPNPSPDSDSNDKAPVIAKPYFDSTSKSDTD